MIELTKTCSKCGEIKSLDTFPIQKGGRYGRASMCKACKKEYDKKYSGRQKEWYKTNKDTVLSRNIKRREEKASEIKEYFKRYRRINNGYINSLNALNKVKKKLRTPAWLSQSDIEKIKALYQSSARISNCLKIEHHVDHIVPLQGKLVSGLHMFENLRIVPGKLNLQKGNKWQIY